MNENDCLVYAFGRWLRVLGLACVMMVLTILALAREAESVEVDVSWIRCFGAFVLGTACMLNGFATVLRIAIDGEKHSWSCVDPRRLAESFSMGLISALAGPPLMIGVAVLFWLNAGPLALIDYLI